MSLTFRLMTYNILDGGIGREAAVVEVIQAAAPDVIVVQEVMQPTVFERIAVALDMTHRLAQGPEWGRKVGLLSRLPILASRSHRLWWVGRHCLEASIQLPDTRPLTLYGLHLAPFHSWFFEWLYLTRARSRRPAGLRLCRSDPERLPARVPGRHRA